MERRVLGFAAARGKPPEGSGAVRAGRIHLWPRPSHPRYVDPLRSHHGQLKLSRGRHSLHDTHSSTKYWASSACSFWRGVAVAPGHRPGRSWPGILLVLAAATARRLQVLPAPGWCCSESQWRARCAGSFRTRLSTGRWRRKRLRLRLDDLVLTLGLTRPAVGSNPLAANRHCLWYGAGWRGCGSRVRPLSRTDLLDPCLRPAMWFTSPQRSSKGASRPWPLRCSHRAPRRARLFRRLGILYPTVSARGARRPPLLLSR